MARLNEHAMPICILVFVAALIRLAAGERSTGRELDALWADLAARDPVVAQQAISGFVVRGEEAVAFLAKRLRPVSRPQPEYLARLMADLDSNEFRVRERASRELERLGQLAESALRQALAGRPSPEARRRIERVLETHKSERLHPPAQQLRLARAVEVLEQIGSRSARGVLETCAQGTSEAVLTRDAKGALDRLARKSTGSP
jgi:hypothetical protein